MEFRNYVKILVALFRRTRRKQFNDSEHVPLQSTNGITESEQGIIIIIIM